MGNTVGSQNKISQRQRKVLIGTLLGDGTLELNGKYPRLRVDHSNKQKEYVGWKYNVLRNLAANRIRLFCQKKDIRTNKRYSHYKFDTISSYLFYGLYKKFYTNHKKIVPNNIIEMLNNPLSLAVWYMNDGYKRNDCNALRISTDSYSLKEQKLLLECLKKNFGINARIHKKGKYWNIYIPAIETIKFCNIIRKYTIPEMRYKILTP